jgi:putative tryptophan/tyrosine transport system substrate-binding protein
MQLSALALIVMLIFTILTAPLVSEAQQSAKAPRIGVLMPILDPERTRNVEAFRQGLRDLGYVEGQNLVIESRDAEGKVERLPDLAAELVRLKVDVLVVGGGTRAVRAAKDATSTIPIVMIAGGNALEEGVIASLAHPEGNITGTVGFQREIVQRRLELLKEVVPGLSRLAVLMNRTNASTVDQLHEAQAVVHTMGVELLVLEPQSPDEFPSAFATMQGAGVEALLVFADPFLLESHRSHITALAQQYRLPAMYSSRTYMDAGGLMYYGTNIREHFRRAAYYVDRILKGATPATLPAETPWKFEFVINLKAAKALGLTMPPVVLFQADEVIR